MEKLIEEKVKQLLRVHDDRFPVRVRLVGTDDEIHEVIGARRDMSFLDLLKTIHTCLGLPITTPPSELKLDARWMSDEDWRFISNQVPAITPAGGWNGGISSPWKNAKAPFGDEPVNEEEAEAFYEQTVARSLRDQGKTISDGFIAKPWQREAHNTASDFDQSNEEADEEANTRAPIWEGNRHTPITGHNCGNVLDLLKMRKGVDFVSVTRDVIVGSGHRRKFLMTAS